jgi:hypothetical protein
MVSRSRDAGEEHLGAVRRVIPGSAESRPDSNRIKTSLAYPRGRDPLGAWITVHTLLSTPQPQMQVITPDLWIAP